MKHLPSKRYKNILIHRGLKLNDLLICHITSPFNQKISCISTIFILEQGLLVGAVVLARLAERSLPILGSVEKLSLPKIYSNGHINCWKKKKEAGNCPFKLPITTFNNVYCHCIKFYSLSCEVYCMRI